MPTELPKAKEIPGVYLDHVLYRGEVVLHCEVIINEDIVRCEYSRTDSGELVAWAAFQLFDLNLVLKPSYNPIDVRTCLYFNLIHDHILFTVLFYFPELLGPLSEITFEP